MKNKIKKKHAIAGIIWIILGFLFLLGKGWLGVGWFVGSWYWYQFVEDRDGK